MTKYNAKKTEWKMRATKCVTIDSETHKKLKEIAEEWGMTMIDAVGVIIGDEYERAIEESNDKIPCTKDRC